MIVVWDVETANPVSTIFNPHPQGTVAMDISPDCKYIATLSAEPPKAIALWNWSDENNMMMLSQELPAICEDPQWHIRFNKWDPKELVTNGSRRVIFWQWEDDNQGFEY